MERIVISDTRDHLEFRALSDGRVLVVCEEGNALLGSGRQTACFALDAGNVARVVAWLANSLSAGAACSGCDACDVCAEEGVGSRGE